MNQIIYTSVIRYCKTKKHYEKVLELIEKVSKTDNYQTFLLNIILETLSLAKYYKKEDKMKECQLIEELILELSMNDKVSDLVLKYT